MLEYALQQPLRETTLSKHTYWTVYDGQLGNKTDFGDVQLFEDVTGMFTVVKRIDIYVHGTFECIRMCFETLSTSFALTTTLKLDIL